MMYFLTKSFSNLWRFFFVDGARWPYSLSRLAALMNPVEPTLIVVRQALRWLVAHVGSRSLYLARFLSTAASIPASNGMVSSTKQIELSLHMMRSGLLSVMATS